MLYLPCVDEGCSTPALGSGPALSTYLWEWVACCACVLCVRKAVAVPVGSRSQWTVNTRGIWHGSRPWEGKCTLYTPRWELQLCCFNIVSCDRAFGTTLMKNGVTAQMVVDVLKWFCHVSWSREASQTCCWWWFLSCSCNKPFWCMCWPSAVFTFTLETKLLYFLLSSKSLNEAAVAFTLMDLQKHHYSIQAGCLKLLFIYFFSQCDAEQCAILTENECFWT